MTRLGLTSHPLPTRLRLALLSLGFAILLTAMTAASAQATIVGEAGGKGLFVLDTGEPVSLYGKSTVTGYGVSPSGEEVVFSTKGEVRIINVETKEEEVVTTPEKTGVGWSEVRFSPNAKYIIGHASTEEIEGIFSMKVNGTEIHELTAGPDHWPIMSSQGALAYLERDPSEVESDLMIIYPSAIDKGVPEVIASYEEYGKKGGVPTFSPDGETIVYPIIEGTTAHRMKFFDVETGAYEREICCPERPEWATESTGLETQGSAYSFLISNGVNTLVAKAPAGGPSYTAVRANQFGGEGVPPEAVQPSLYIRRLKPMMVYDEQEPYFADEASEIVSGIGFEGAQLYGPRLKDVLGNVLADPFYEEPEFAEEWGWTPEGEFKLNIEALAGTYPPNAEEVELLALEGDYVDEHNDTRQENAAFLHEEGFGNHIYARWVQEGEDIWIQYWFFYYFNNGFLGEGDHEGDWEGVQVHLSAESSYLPESIVFNSHKGARRCAPGEISLTESDGPWVFVANGSHASYPASGTWETEVPFHSDSITVGEESFVSPDLEHMSESEPDWVTWPGHWGGSESSPLGPARPEHETEWAEPQVWEEEAEECFAGYESERPMAARRGSGAARISAVGRGGAHVGLDLVKAKRTPQGVKVKYRLTHPGRIGMGPFAVILSVNSEEDEAPPRTIYVHRRARRGSATVPYPNMSSGPLEVLGSVATGRYRSKVQTLEIGP